MRRLLQTKNILISTPVKKGAYISILNIIQSALLAVNQKEAIVDNGGGTSDGRWIAPSGAEVIELGPINQTIHQIDEKISLSDLELLTRIYHQILVVTQAAAN